MLVVWLWFDVEVRYNTTLLNREIFLRELWFDVEVRYNTTLAGRSIGCLLLWFDVEVRYNTTRSHFINAHISCGLM